MLQGPGFIFLFHPALGPLWEVIAQKMKLIDETRDMMNLKMARAELKRQEHIDGIRKKAREEVSIQIEEISVMLKQWN